jgi:hypothetical protein
MEKIKFRTNSNFRFLQKLILTEAFIEIGANNIISQMAAQGLMEYKNDLRRTGRLSEIEYIYLDIVETIITPIGNQILIVLGVAFISPKELK